MWGENAGILYFILKKGGVVILVCFVEGGIWVCRFGGWWVYFGIVSFSLKKLQCMYLYDNIVFRNDSLSIVVFHVPFGFCITEIVYYTGSFMHLKTLLLRLLIDKPNALLSHYPYIVNTSVILLIVSSFLYC